MELFTLLSWSHKSVRSMRRRVWVVRRIALISATALVAMLPIVTQDPYYITIAINVLITLLLTLSLNFIIGFSGQFSFAHAAFFGIGAYGPTIFSKWIAIPPWIGLPVGVGSSIAVALLIGLPLIRLRGYYFAVATLAFNFFMEIAVRQGGDMTGGVLGISGLPPPTLFGVPLRGGAYYEMALVIVLTVLLLFNNLIHSPLGRSIIATRENETTAAAMGIDVVRIRLVAFIISAGVAAVGGWVHAYYHLWLNPLILNPELNFVWLFMVFIGGLAHVPGVIIGTLLLTIGPEVVGFATEHDLLAIGFLMIVVALFAPSGLGGVLDHLNRIGGKYLRSWGKE